MGAGEKKIREQIGKVSLIKEDLAQRFSTLVANLHHLENLNQQQQEQSYDCLCPIPGSLSHLVRSEGSAVFKVLQVVLIGIKSGGTLSLLQ